VAEVELFDEPAPTDDTSKLVRECETVVRTALAHQTELGIAGPPATVALSSDPVVAGWQLCSVVPAGPLDRQRLLEIAGHDERLRLLASLAAGAVELFARRLASG
jgi:hypothetical protein